MDAGQNFSAFAYLHLPGATPRYNNLLETGAQRVTDEQTNGIYKRVEAASTLLQLFIEVDVVACSAITHIFTSVPISLLSLKCQATLDLLSSSFSTLIHAVKMAVVIPFLLLAAITFAPESILTGLNTTNPLPEQRNRVRADLRPQIEQEFAEQVGAAKEEKNYLSRRYNELLARAKEIAQERNQTRERVGRLQQENQDLGRQVHALQQSQTERLQAQASKRDRDRRLAAEAAMAVSTLGSSRSTASALAGGRPQPRATTLSTDPSAASLLSLSVDLPAASLSARGREKPPILPKPPALQAGQYRLRGKEEERDQPLGREEVKVKSASRVRSGEPTEDLLKPVKGELVVLSAPASQIVELSSGVAGGVAASTLNRPPTPVERSVEVLRQSSQPSQALGLQPQPVRQRVLPQPPEQPEPGLAASSALGSGSAEPEVLPTNREGEQEFTTTFFGSSDWPPFNLQSTQAGIAGGGASAEEQVTEFFGDSGAGGFDPTVTIGTQVDSEEVASNDGSQRASNVVTPDLPGLETPPPNEEFAGEDFPPQQQQQNDEPVPGGGSSVPASTTRNAEI